MINRRISLKPSGMICLTGRHYLGRVCEVGPSRQVLISLSDIRALRTGLLTTPFARCIAFPANILRGFIRIYCEDLFPQSNADVFL